MKKSRYRIIKSIGIGLFLLFFGVFIYFLISPQGAEQTQMVSSPGSQEPEVLTGNASPTIPVGFDYQKTSNSENSDT